MKTRREFLRVGALFLAAPAIVKVANIMPVKVVPALVHHAYRVEYHIEIPDYMVANGMAVVPEGAIRDEVRRTWRTEWKPWGELA